MPKLNQYFKQNTQLDQQHIELLFRNILKIGENIHNAEKHIRGMKAAHYMKRAIAELDKALHAFGTNYSSIIKPAKIKAKNICPEVYKGTTYGYPLYETGFVEQNCTYSMPLSELLTILTIGSVQSVGTMIASIQKTYPDVKVIASVNTKEGKRLLENKFKNNALSFLSHQGVSSQGMIWNKLMQLVNTKYAFISRDTTEIDEYSRFRRLIREMEIQNKLTVSGSIRHINSHWRIGCYQRAFRNYTLFYYEGYDESVNECLICDHVDGPFVMKTEVFKKHTFNEGLIGEGIFEDFFIKIGTENTLNCPEAMFHVNQQERSKDHKKWEVFAKINEVVRLRFIPGFEINFPCTTSEKCYKGGKYAIHPCCLQTLSNMVILAMKICNEAHAVCELDSGTFLSAVKMNTVFPWEVDGDTIFESKKRKVIEQTANKLKNNTFTITPDKNYLWYNVKNWFVEAWEQSRLSSDKYIENGRNQTKVLFDGHWLAVGKNPALMSRNRYGPFCFQHSIPWRIQGAKSSWIQYKTDVFPECTTPGNHKCMDLFRTDGNLQFSDPIP